MSFLFLQQYTQTQFSLGFVPQNWCSMMFKALSMGKEHDWIQAFLVASVFWLHIGEQPIYAVQTRAFS